jgi:hypothetical protein
VLTTVLDVTVTVQQSGARLNQYLLVLQDHSRRFVHSNFRMGVACASYRERIFRQSHKSWTASRHVMLRNNPVTSSRGPIAECCVARSHRR